LLYGNSGLGLPGCNSAEGHQEFVVHCKDVLEEGANDFLDSKLAGSIQDIRRINFRSDLDHDAIGDRLALVGMRRRLFGRGYLNLMSRLLT
jgi:hypothetical protein